MSTNYEWEIGMREISGMGGGYEAECRLMLKQGMKWIEAHPDAKPMYHGFKGIYGIIKEDNEDAKALSNAACEGRDVTGAMHQAVISHIIFISKNGWPKYVEEMKKGNA